MTIEIPKNVEVIEVVGLKEWLEEHDKQIRADVKKEINEIMDMDVPISNILYEIDKWLKEQK